MQTTQTTQTTRPIPPVQPIEQRFTPEQERALLQALNRPSAPELRFLVWFHPRLG